jgi:hypothetical protein
MMQCVQAMIAKPMLFQPFEGVGEHSDSVVEPVIPAQVVERGAGLFENLTEYGPEFTDFVQEYMKHRPGAGGLKITNHLPSVVCALGGDVVVLRMVRNLVDAVLSTMQHWPDDGRDWPYHEWEGSRVFDAKRYSLELPWDSVRHLEGPELIVGDRLLQMHALRRETTAWLENSGTPYLDVSMERASACPAYVAPGIGELIGVGADKVLGVLAAAKASVYSYPPLRDAAEIRRVEEIADFLGVPRL